jgi:hypothetical protein
LEKQAGPGGVLKKSLLLIDDESDYASVNTNEEEDPTSINRGIRDLLNSFDVSTYLAVTATPFANILIDSPFHQFFLWTRVILSIECAPPIKNIFLSSIVKIS